MEMPHELGNCFLYPLSHSSEISGWIHKAWLLARSSMLISVSWEGILVFADSLLCCWSDQFGDVTDKSFHIVRGIRSITRGAIICFWNSLWQKNAKECRILYQALRKLLRPFPHSQTVLPYVTIYKTGQGFFLQPLSSQEWALNHRLMGVGTSHFYYTVPCLLLWSLEIKFSPNSWIFVVF